MRLQLGIILACLTLAGTAASDAQEREDGAGDATARLLVYDDNDATTVVTSIADVDATLPGAISIGAHTVLDAVSSASVDVVSAATGRWQENRVEVGARAVVPVAGSNLTVGTVRSQENDWLSHTASLAGSRELFQKNTVLSAGYGFTRNKIGRAMDPSFERSLLSHSAEVSVGQLLDRKSRGGIAYSFQALSGFQSSPYRYVAASDGTTVPERHPDKRRRHALSAFVLRSLTPRASARIDYRLYRDDWGIASHTGTVRFSVELSKRVSAALDGRLYNQSQADFYRASYPTSFRFMSSDRELASMWNVGGNAQLGLQLGPLKLDARVGAIRYRFRNFPRLPRRVALLAGGGAKVEW